MGILSGALTARRFRVVGTLPEDFRDKFRAQLQQYAFREPPQGMGKEEVEGWVLSHNLLESDFEDFNRWLFNEYVLLQLRVDKKRLPAKLFAATVDQKCRGYAEEHQLQKCPASKRKEIKEALEMEWLKRTLPSVSVTEAVWNINQEWMILHSLSDGVAERFRKRFYQTFALKLVPYSPLDHAANSDLVDALLAKSPSVFAEAP